VVKLPRTDARSGGSGGAGLFTVVSVVILVVGVLVISIAAALLARTLAAAQSIDKKAQTIAVNAGKINVSTDSVIKLNRTNELASSILVSTKPLQGLLNTIDATARDIADLAKSINTTAGTIKATVGTDQRDDYHDQQHRYWHQQPCRDDQRHHAGQGITGSEILCTG
jgi:type II secretory pathway pseudopilin PulG